jgi:hypothetical protein
MLEDRKVSQFVVGFTVFDCQTAFGVVNCTVKHFVDKNNNEHHIRIK